KRSNCSLNRGGKAMTHRAGLRMVPSRLMIMALLTAAGMIGSLTLLTTPPGGAAAFAGKKTNTPRAGKSHRARARTPAPDLLCASLRRDRNGWIYVHLEGTPDQVGYQHGYWLAPEIKEALRVFSQYLPHTTRRDWQFYRHSAHSLFWDKIGDEYQREISGIARGANARLIAGSRKGEILDKGDGEFRIDVDDILALNAWIELAQYYVPSLQARLSDPGLHQSPPPSCSAFIATGSWTRNGQIVIAHNNWIDYLIGRHWNVIVDLKPAAGHRILMDSFPGFIHS